MNFTYLLNQSQWQATFEQEEDSAIAAAYSDGVKERLKFVFYHARFDEWFDLENWAKLSTLDLPFISANAQEWAAWHGQPENEDLYSTLMPWPAQEELHS
jgi:hypothetical protein